MENVNVNTTVNEDDSTRGKLIFSYPISKALIKMGHRVIDLKENRETHMPILVFEDSLQLRDDLQSVVKERRKARAERAKAESEEEVKEPIEQED